MQAVIGTGKRFALTLFSALTLGQHAMVLRPLNLWAASWWVNRSSIVLFTGVNASITTISEFASRGILAVASEKDEQKFFVHDSKGHKQVHRQSLINILMTILASLLGGPVYFIRKRWQRFVFFLSFGVFSSMASQAMAYTIRDGIVTITLGRLLFDFCYNGTVKYWMFEFARPAILRFRNSFSGVGALRMTQDFLQTLLRVGLLNFFGIH